MNRRGLLAGILAAAAAPAIARAGSLMPIYVPTPRLILPKSLDLGAGDFTVESWVKPGDAWVNLAIVTTMREVRHYLDGTRVDPRHPGLRAAIPLMQQTLDQRALMPGLVGGLRITRGVREIGGQE